ncbi:LysR family transcriptional regulator [Gilliamella sp. B2889]|uniref:LysR family transcriptional regulator n=1 Tax=Gilliamella sp. B2889 TaxID=2817985 RepID=UPI00226A2D63|nr:LysR family transcriptional regulator [Gilliamella sp. B2889]MCX8682296.1 LysR family transcriptional regulator [Gilliamella sp. B2889]
MDIYSKRLPTIKQLQYFIAVCEELSFTGAAKKLGISQPPLSTQIKNLEETLQSTLFLRNSHNIVLTNEGEILKSKVTQLLSDLCSMVKSTKHLEKVIIGTTKTLSFDYIPYFKSFLSKFSDETEIYKHNYTSKELILELQKGNIDFAFVSDYPTRDFNENSILIYQEPMTLVLPAHHPCSKQDKVNLNDVIDLPLFWFKQHLNPFFYDQCEKVFNSLNHPLHRRTELADNLSMLLEVALGKAIMLLPQSMTQMKVDGVIYKKLINSQDKKLKINIYLIWRKNIKTSTVNQAIIDYFNQHKIS